MYILILTFLINGFSPTMTTAEFARLDYCQDAGKAWVESVDKGLSRSGSRFSYVCVRSGDY